MAMYSCQRKIAEHNGIKVNHVSKVLSELKSKDLLECINPEACNGPFSVYNPMGKKF